MHGPGRWLGPLSLPAEASSADARSRDHQHRARDGGGEPARRRAASGVDLGEQPRAAGRAGPIGFSPSRRSRPDSSPPWPTSTAGCRRCARPNPARAARRPTRTPKRRPPPPLRRPSSPRPSRRKPSRRRSRWRAPTRSRRRRTARSAPPRRSWSPRRPAQRRASRPPSRWQPVAPSRLASRETRSAINPDEIETLPHPIPRGVGGAIHADTGRRADAGGRLGAGHDAGPTWRPRCRSRRCRRSATGAAEAS